MADGAPVNYSYSPSGSTIELIDLASTRPSSQLSSRISSRSTLSWHPKLTLYRLLVILSTVGLAVAKSATSYLNLTFASITLEWILGVVVFLFFQLLGAYEETNNRYCAWLFNFDCMEYLWAFLENLTGFHRPYYISDEIDARQQAAGIHPPLTGYRIIVTLVVAVVGMTKSALLYGQEPMEATTVDCVFGVGIVTGLYWLGLYEASSTKAYPKLFHVDYFGGLSYITETVVVFLHLFALLISIAASYGFYLLTASLFSYELAAKMKGTKTIDLITLAILIGGVSSFMSLGAAMGAFVLIYHLGRRYRASLLAQIIASFPGVRFIPYVHRKYWLPSGASLRPRPRSFYLKRLLIRQSIKIPLNLALLYVATFMLMCCVALSLAWCSLLMDLRKDSPWYGLLFFFLMSVALVPSFAVGAAVAVHFILKGVVHYFLDAWKDFTVEIELGSVPIEAPFEGV